MLKCNAVTLIEVMVIVAIIGIVIAVAVPAQMRSQQISHARACQENMSRISGAVEALALERSLSGNTPIKIDDLVQTTGTGFLHELPRCPAGGFYSVTRAGAVPTCTIAHNPSVPYAPHIYPSAIPFVTR